MFIEDKIKENVELNDIKEYRIYKNTKSVVREGGETGEQNLLFQESEDN